MIQITIQEADRSGCNGMLLWYRDRWGNLTCTGIADAEEVLTVSQCTKFYHGQSDFTIYSRQLNKVGIYI